MKRAVILHGTDANPESNWFPWLKKKLEEQGYQVWVPLLPGNHTPDRQVYNDFLLSSDWDFTDNIVVGHSSGAVEVMNLLMDDRCPKIKLGVMVSAWKSNDGELTPDQVRAYKQAGLSREQFKNTFPPAGFDFKKIRSNADKLMFMHSDDDPYCPIEQAKYLAENLDAPLTVLHGAEHIGSNFAELPELWQILEPNL